MNLKEALEIEQLLSPAPTREQLTEALGVLAERVRETMWQPADTVPMHVRVLVASKCGQTIIAVRAPMGWRIEGMVHADADGLFVITHWMPLPEPPEKSK